METLAASKILVTGATGSIGKELVRQLSAAGYSFRAMVRSLENAKELSHLPGVQLVLGDFDQIASLETVLAGVERVFLLTNSSENAENQQIDFVKAAQKAGVKHIVKLSQWAASVNSPVRFLRYHAIVEDFIKDSGIAFTFLRPNLFMQGMLGFKHSIVNQGKFYGSLGDAKVSLVDVSDIAKVAVCALTKPGHAGKVYNLTGPEALSHYVLAEKLSQAVGYQVQFVDVPSDILQEMLMHAGFPEWQAEGLVEDYVHYQKGEAAEVTADIPNVTGQPAGSFDDFVARNASLFKK